MLALFSKLFTLVLSEIAKNAIFTIGGVEDTKLEAKPRIQNVFSRTSSRPRTRGGAEDTRLEAKIKDTKKSEAKGKA